MENLPNLKIVGDEILALLEKYNVAGIVLLASPGIGCCKTHLTPTWSVTYKLDDKLLFKIEAGADGKAFNEGPINNTNNMLHVLTKLMDRELKNLQEIRNTFLKISSSFKKEYLKQSAEPKMPGNFIITISEALRILVDAGQMFFKLGMGRPRSDAEGFQRIVKGLATLGAHYVIKGTDGQNECSMKELEEQMLEIIEKEVPGIKEDWKTYLQTKLRVHEN